MTKIHNKVEENENDNLEHIYEWRRLLIWLALKAGLLQDAALLAVHNDMLQDQLVLRYGDLFPEFLQEVQRLNNQPLDM